MGPWSGIVNAFTDAAAISAGLPAHDPNRAAVIALLGDCTGWAAAALGVETATAVATQGDVRVAGALPVRSLAVAI